jgi:hypothetical protein
MNTLQNWNTVQLQTHTHYTIYSCSSIGIQLFMNLCTTNHNGCARRRTYFTHILLQGVWLDLSNYTAPADTQCANGAAMHDTCTRHESKVFTILRPCLRAQISFHDLGFTNLLHPVADIDIGVCRGRCGSAAHYAYDTHHDTIHTHVVRACAPSAYRSLNVTYYDENGAYKIDSST